MQGKKKALLIATSGSDRPEGRQTTFALRSLMKMKKILEANGFNKEDMRILIDEEGYQPAIDSNVRSEITRLLEDAVEGDHLCIYINLHGGTKQPIGPSVKTFDGKYLKEEFVSVRYAGSFSGCVENTESSVYCFRRELRPRQEVQYVRNICSLAERQFHEVVTYDRKVLGYGRKMSGHGRTVPSHGRTDRAEVAYTR
ncbi:hypothetical protein OROGR_022889 [Orobanche gracilis]